MEVMGSHIMVSLNWGREKWGLEILGAISGTEFGSMEGELINRGG